jgi:fatty-acid peroxygenase
VTAPIPRDGPDGTLALLREGYEFVARRCDRHGSDLFETRLMLRRVVCLRGAEAARLFYEGDRLTRRGAIPLPTLLLLQDAGSVQTLDDDAHRWRKRLFMSVLTPEAVGRLAGRLADEWRARLPAWGRMGEVVLLLEVRRLLCRAACAWAGLPLDEAEARRRTAEFGAMVEGAGAVGPSNWWAQLLRARADRPGSDGAADRRGVDRPGVPLPHAPIGVDPAARHRRRGSGANQAVSARRGDSASALLPHPSGLLP